MSLVPAIVHYSPYGKSGTGLFDLDLIPGRAGIPRSAVSGFQSFEAFDPAEWVAHGYAVVNVDARGVFGSQGDSRFLGTAEGRDGHDAIEHISQLPWCTGKVALAGNSWLAMTQWFIAAERPAHLTCIMPLEGCSDAYRETLCRGGVPSHGFFGFISPFLYGSQQREDVIAMLQKYPVMNEYWQDKRADISSIRCPAYVLASISTGLHTVGSLRGFEDIPHDKKWYAATITFYTQRCQQASQAGLILIDCRSQTILWDVPLCTSLYIANIDNLLFAAWPVPEINNITLRLSVDGTLQSSFDLVKSGQSSYISDAKAENDDADPEELSFTYTFTQRTRLIGNSKAVLYMSCPDHSDLDVFLILRKVDKDGRVLRHINIPFAELKAVGGDGIEGVEDPLNLPRLNAVQYVGPSGILRASHREIDASISKHNFPHHKHTNEEKIQPGQVVRLEIGIWAAAIQFEAGEKLMLRVSGHDMRLPEFEPLRGKFTTGNKGRHVVHIGKEYDSYLVSPLLEC
ncbi:X-Pro dipeptidyl-peptidase C-terminal non-catalytic domain containing protein [Pyrenophora tritici-repentis]|nr:X-Pro dipeptidyl-peptidase C-terminal non-catalytic domain containing protein [Pyrenophora tritici-repentis]